MIRVRLPAKTIPPEFLAAAKLELREVLAHFRNPKTRNRPFTFEAYQNKKLKAQLDGVFHGKCAYCEWRYEGGSYFEVEHYRPKSHYYWLAAEWSNLLPACKRCNNGKRTKFPLADPRKQARRKGEERREKPLLLNPCNPKLNPQDHLLFDTDDGAIKPALHRRAQPSKIGETSIAIYRLSRSGLSLDRKMWAIRVKDKIQIRRLVELGGNAAAKKEAYQGLRHLLEPHQPFRALTIQILRENGFGRQLT